MKLIFNSKKIMPLFILIATTLILLVNIQSIMAQSDNENSMSPGNAVVMDGNGAAITNGTNGHNGADGQSGSIGHSGANGQNGANGQDAPAFSDTTS
ncbi:MAG TPA: hypothetical protein VIY08_05065 [Candidatus Nitrosocosmicus sp.]